MDEEDSAPTIETTVTASDQSAERPSTSSTGRTVIEARDLSVYYGQERRSTR